MGDQSPKSSDHCAEIAAPSAAAAGGASMSGPAPESAHEEDSGTLHSVLKWVFRASVAGLGLSILVHIVLAIVAALIIVDRPHGSAGASALEVDLAVVTDSELRELQEQALNADAIELADLTVDTPIDLSLFEPASIDDASLTEVDLGGPGPIGGAGGEGVAPDMVITGGGGGGASFFGVEAQGSRFAYIVDVSASMSGAKIEAMRMELIDSVNNLYERTSFIVFFYSDRLAVLGGKARWLDTNDKNRQWAGREIRAVSAFGGTNPLPAFEMALAMKPRPDAIYFMTDGIFDPAAAGIIAELNSRGGGVTPIHCISFVSREAESMLRKMARDSDGTYTHVSDPNLTPGVPGVPGGGPGGGAP